MGTSLEIDILLIGFSAATCGILFSDGRGRRVLMAAALACAVGIVVMHLMGLYRVLLMAFIAYLARDWWRERRAAAIESSALLSDAPDPEVGEATSRGSSRRR